MKYYYLTIAIAIVSCGSPKEKKEVSINQTNVNTLELIDNIDEGIFIDYFSLTKKDYNFQLEPGETSSSLNKIIIPLEFKISQKYPYNNLTKQDQFILNVDFFNEKKEIIEELNVNSTFETVKYFKVKFIDFKELLNSNIGEVKNYNFNFFVDNNLSEKFKTNAKYFSISIRKNSPENQLKNAVNSLSKSNHINSSEFNNGNIKIKYNQQVLGDYWKSGKKIEKFLVGEPTRIFSKIKNAKSVEITLPFNDKTYIAFVNKSNIEKLSKLKIEDIKSDFNSFSDVFIYGLNNEKRKYFYDKTVKLK
jgi:hypothetical protein